MDLGLRDRVALVCAASQGLGKAAAIALYQEGAHVAICSRDRERLLAAAEEIRASSAGETARVLPIEADVTDPKQIKKLVAATVKEFERIDILVTNAGGPPVAMFSDLDDSAWEKGVALTLMSTVRCIREVLPHMQKRKWGRVVNITSISSKEPITDLVISSSIRPGILGLTKVLSHQLAKDNILVNSVAPGYILTARQKEISSSRAGKKGLSLEEYMQDLVKDVPLGRYGNPEELAAMIAFLASERASYITGATISVDGGLSKGLF